jgi:hypothetical protein
MRIALSETAPSPRARRVAPRLCLLLVLGLALGVMTGCGDGGSGGGGGITIPQNDSTPPDFNLGVAEVKPNGPSIVVKPGGPDESLKLSAKTGTVNLLITAKDPESGVKETQMWISKTTTRCAQNVCQTSGPGLLGSPSFKAGGQAKSPGETTAASSIHGESFDLAQEIPQAAPPPGSSLSVKLEFWAVAINHLGGRAETAKATLTWSESG